jgi:hypothetical protein
VQKTLKKIIAIVLTILIFSLAFSVDNQNVSSATIDNQQKLGIFTSSPSVLADNSTYNCIYVQLQDNSGKPVRALQDITIGLSSSLMYIGTVDSSITLLKGDTFAVANFTSTFNPGNTTISASATGYSTVITSITTVGPIPSAVAVYGFPSTLPADGNSYSSVMVQLQDSSSCPARAPQGGVEVSLSCSDTTVGTVTPVVTILEGQTYTIANFTTSTKAQDEAKTEAATITAVSQGYTPNQFTITTTPLASTATKLKIFTGPPKIPADNNSYSQIAVQLQNALGYAAEKQSADILVNLASNDSSICRVDQIIIPQGQTFSVATVNTTFKAGLANITAVANDFALTNQSLTTFGFIPSKLAVYCIPPGLPSDGKTYQTIQVQLQDAQGRPAKGTITDVSVKLYSSQPNVGVVSSLLTIPLGKTQATSNLTSTYTPGNTSITAQTSGYTTGQATLYTYLIDNYTISSSAGANGSITPNGNSTVILGGSQLFNITVNPGYHISDVTVDNVSQGAISTYTFSNVSKGHTIVANFAINTYNLNVTQTANGMIAPDTSSINYGETPVFTITPNTGYHIANISSNNASIVVTSASGQSYQFNPVTANGSLTALFAINTYTIKVTQTDNGTISPGTINVCYNGSQTFTISPKTGCHIVDVLVNGASVGAVSYYTAENIQGATTISAVFANDPPSTPQPTPSPTPTTAPVTTTTVKATVENGATINLLMNGNITSQQITNAKIIENESASATTILFNITGENGTLGSGNFTIPKSQINFGSSPTLYIDGVPALDQGFSQDTDNYYVWFTTHFSNHEVSIVFTGASSEVPAEQSILSQNAIYAVAAVIIAIATTSSVFVVKRYKKNKVFG